MLTISNTFKTLATFIRCLTVFGCAWIVYLIFNSIGEHFGIAQFLDYLQKQGILSIVLNILFLLFGISGFISGYKSRSLMKRKTLRFVPRIKELEKIIDEKRSSSGIKETGDTQEGDKI